MLLVLLAVVVGYAEAATIERCCSQKMVGGVNYTLVEIENTTKYGCDWDCVYEKVDMKGSRICFQVGPLPVVCDDQNSWCDNCLETPENNCQFCLEFCVQNVWKVVECVNCIENNCPVCMGPCGGPLIGDDAEGEFGDDVGDAPANCTIVNSRYTGNSFNTQSAVMSFGDCQQRCHRDHVNGGPCTYWNWKQSTTDCSMFQSIIGTESKIGWFRGPINANCPPPA
eukprot:GFUD01109764.1.p1 GENE.GFUD01109764.1~~GFUD01109764.1.p1  ORF type:complete len:225 (-),score=22.46 GFUD01109764.1:163-837(-)